MATPSAPPAGRPRRTRRTRFVCISDTHNSTVALPAGDVLVHCGDLTNAGGHGELAKQVAWLERAPGFECKLVVAGNHDVTLDGAYFAEHGPRHHNPLTSPQDPAACQALLLENSASITYLRHERRVVRLASPSGPRTAFAVFGSPYTPAAAASAPGRWAFQYPDDDDGAAAAETWADIPLDTDVVIAHGPPARHCDESAARGSRGCEALRRALWRVRPRLLLCGHVHEARGAARVRWDLGDAHSAYAEAPCADAPWADPGAGSGNRKISLVDLTGRRRHQGPALDNDGAPAPAHAPQTSPPQFAGAEAGVARPGIGSRGLGGDPDGGRCDAAALRGREGRRETCVVNCAIQASSYPHRGPRRLHKPIVVDIELPVWDEEEEEEEEEE
ncbi:Metallo-dependent phosphatase [Xylariomycetidae sp. FL0641]|nr:Metallo-dependent phosphatase [Xylariomycetidae sp. FL0641]